MQFKDFVEATGATPRQIRYWEPSMPFSTKEHPYFHNYLEDAVKKVRLLVYISNAFGGYFSVDTLAEIYDKFDEGCLVFACDLTLDWSDVDLDEAPN